MKKIFFIFLSSFFAMTSSAQFVAKMEVKEDIPGICDKDEVYALFPSFSGQVEAVCQFTKEQILEKLNTEVAFLKENPKFSGKGMIGLIVNCKGEIVKCEMDISTKKPELDKQIVAVFNSLGIWKPGQLNGKEVDTSNLFSFKIKNGKISFEY